MGDVEVHVGEGDIAWVSQQGSGVVKLERRRTACGSCSIRGRGSGTRRERRRHPSRAGIRAVAMHPRCDPSRPPPGAARWLLGEEVGEQRDRGGVSAQVLGPDLVERVGRAVVDVEVVVPVRLEIERRRAGRDDRLDVGAEGVRLEAADAESREGREQRRHRLDARLAADADRIRRRHPVVRLERGDVVLVAVPLPVRARTREPVLLAGEEHGANGSPRRQAARAQQAQRFHDATQPAPSSDAPCPTSHESMCAPSRTISSGSSRPRSSPMTFALGASASCARSERELDLHRPALRQARRAGRRPRSTPPRRGSCARRRRS